MPSTRGIVTGRKKAREVPPIRMPSILHFRRKEDLQVYRGIRCSSRAGVIPLALFLAGDIAMSLCYDERPGSEQVVFRKGQCSHTVTENPV
jgi:hypothetical protein